MSATLQRLKSYFYWKGQTKDVRQFIHHCDTCQRSKNETVAPPGLLNPLPIPQHVFSDISTDFIGGLPKSKGKDTIFVVVDHLALSHPYAAADVTQVFSYQVYKLHGCPTTIVSDRDVVFLSAFWTDFMKLHGVSLALSTTYHPQTDGQTEAVNRCLENYLRGMVFEHPTTWFSWLSLAEWWYNTNFHSSLGMTPFQALYGFPPPLHIPYIPHDTRVAAVDDHMQERQRLMSLLKQSLHKARNRMKQFCRPTIICSWFLGIFEGATLLPANNPFLSLGKALS